MLPFPHPLQLPKHLMTIKGKSLRSLPASSFEQSRHLVDGVVVNPCMSAPLFQENVIVCKIIGQNDDRISSVKFA